MQSSWPSSSSIASIASAGSSSTSKRISHIRSRTGSISPKSSSNALSSAAAGGGGGIAAAAATQSDVLMALKQEWYPCTQGQRLVAYMAQESNGPFLRALCNTWRRLGSPPLETLEELRRPGHARFDLAALSLQQEMTIAAHVQQSMVQIDLFFNLKPFETFAAQLGLYSAIKAELVAIEHPTFSKEERERLYHDVWKQQLEDFDRARDQTCAKDRNHLCLGTLLWGKAYHWPLDALQHAYVGYTVQLQQQSPTNVQLQQQQQQQQQISPPSVTVQRPPQTQQYTTPPSTAPFTPPAMLSSMTSTSSSASSVKTPPAPSSLAQQHLTATSPAPLMSRRPTMTDFWENGMANFIGSVDMKEATEAAEFLTFEPLNTSSATDDVFANFASTFGNFAIAPSASLDTDLTIPLPLSISEPWQLSASTSTLSVQSKREMDEADEGESGTSKKAKRDSISSSSATAEATTADERGKRHYARIKAQRRMLREVVTHMRTLSTQLQKSHSLGQTRVAQLMSQACAVHDDASAGSSSSEGVASSNTSVVKAIRTMEEDANQRKRMSKRRLRANELSNMQMLIRLANIIVEIPISRVATRLRCIQSAASKQTIDSSDNDDDRALDHVLRAWLNFEDGWNELILAEKRFIPTGIAQGRSIDTAVQLLLIAKGLQ